MKYFLVSLVLMLNPAAAAIAQTQDFSDFLSAHSEPGEVPGLPAFAVVGKTASGNNFTYGSENGSVSVPSRSDQEWRINCSNDAMSDARHCTATRNDDAMHIMLFFGRPNPTGICVLSHDFPGRSAAIRINSAEPVNIPEGCTDAGEAKKIFKAMVPGATIRTRYYVWPYDYAVDKEAILDDSYPDMLRLSSFLFSKGNMSVKSPKVH